MRDCDAVKASMSGTTVASESTTGDGETDVCVPNGFDTVTEGVNCPGVTYACVMGRPSANVPSPKFQ